ncbi:MAG: DEAD/DEAH box helicase, partial [Flavobacteriales bacterium]|nr:DEAD/DEAH box helicase [Flavobacteriales bacterium]
MRFDELDIPYELMDGIKAMGFDETTPIQEAAIPPILEGKDLIGIAQTGTGKTAAFLIPLMSILMDMGERKGVGALIVVPTRELAVQIDQAAQGLSYFTGMSSMAIYGGGDGMDFKQERAALTGGAD